MVWRHYSGANKNLHRLHNHSTASPASSFRPSLVQQFRSTTSSHFIQNERHLNLRPDARRHASRPYLNSSPGLPEDPVPGPHGQHLDPDDHTHDPALNAPPDMLTASEQLATGLFHASEHCPRELILRSPERVEVGLELVFQAAGYSSEVLCCVVCSDLGCYDCLRCAVPFNSGH